MPELNTRHPERSDGDQNRVAACTDALGDEAQSSTVTRTGLEPAPP